MLSSPSQSDVPATASPLIRAGSDGRLRFDPRHRQALLDAFDAGGTSALSFARSHGVKYPTFMSWLAKRRNHGSVEAGDCPGFAEVVIEGAAAPPPGAVALRVTLPCGSVLEICSRAALPLAAELLNSLRRPC